MPFPGNKNCFPSASRFTGEDRKKNKTGFTFPFAIEASKKTILSMEVNIILLRIEAKSKDYELFVKCRVEFFINQMFAIFCSIFRDQNVTP